MSFGSVVVFWRNNIVYYTKNDCQDTFCKNHCTLIHFLWFTKVKYVKFPSILISIEST